MNKCFSQWFVPFAGSALLLAGSGCAMFRGSVAEVDVNQKQHMDADYDYTDMKQMTQGFVNDILASKFIASATSPTTASRPQRAQIQ